MRRFLSLVVISSVVFMLSACTSGSLKWRKYTAGDGTFSINMPDGYVKTEKSENTVFGRQVVHYVTWKPSVFALGKFKLFQITYTDCPKGYTSDTLSLGALLDRSINE